tara:strand:- start:62 stop:490 length:429 start_codon:yes stop_codon:yes gene_type:complete
MIRHHETNEWIYTYGDAVEALSPPGQGNEYHYECKKINGVPQYEKYENIVWYENNKDPKPSKTEVKNKFDELKNARPMQLLRQERNRKLAETDWRATVDYPGTDKNAWLTYRQSLRDLPSTASPKLDEEGNLTNVTWPTEPE